MEAAIVIRLSCIVPHCTHTRGQRKGEPPIDPSEEWCCGQHWRLVSRETRQRHSKAARLARKAHRQGMAEELVNRLRWRTWRAWDRCKAEAIERAMGI